MGAFAKATLAFFQSFVDEVFPIDDAEAAGIFDGVEPFLFVFLCVVCESAVLVQFIYVLCLQSLESFHAFAKPSLALAITGCSIFGLGSEIAGVAVTRSLAKWFKGKEMALAMGLQLALARLGTATALVAVPYLVTVSNGRVPFSETIRPAHVGLVLMAIGVALWIVFLAMDSKFDSVKAAEEAAKNDGKQKEKDEFKFSDIGKILSNKYFILVSLLCVFFYCCIISFRRFATSIIIPRFGIHQDVASIMVALIPFCTMVFTPIFGYVVDRKGRGTRLMLTGSIMVLVAHLIVAFAPRGMAWCGYLGIGMLGIGYALVPAAMWPSVPKIIPEKNLGTAFSLIYWVQNIGLLIVPIIVGKVIDKTNGRFITGAADLTPAMKVGKRWPEEVSCLVECGDSALDQEIAEHLVYSQL